MNADAPTPPPDRHRVLATESAPELVLRWLVPLRFLLAGSEALGLGIAAVALALPLPYAALSAVPALTVASNLVLLVLARRGAPGARVLVPAALVVDVVLFSFLLAKSGGPDNPFSALYAIPIAMAAMSGSVRATWSVAAIATAGYALAFVSHDVQHFWHAPIYPGSPIGLHAAGMWLAVVAVALVIAFFFGRITRTLQEREREIRRLGDVAERNARLASLTTLAAGAAHELGSPLGTIAVVARELERQADREGAAVLGEDARLLRAEADRCRRILDGMLAHAEREKRDGVALAAADVPALLAEAAGDACAGRLRVELAPSAAGLLGARGDFLEMVMPLVRNALDASPPETRVDVRVERHERRLRVSVRDRGEGMDAPTLARAGEPFFTTRAPGRGTGLGLFVVRLNAERLGGELRHRSEAGRGTEATVEWELDPRAR